jgi:gamma-glutamyl:cysteine ligase YbdK (ATP-grasp superfamily)
MGEPWLWYTVTAADQAHVAIGRDEAIPMLNFGNLIAPALIALCANSPVWGGTASPYCSAREAQHVLIHANEHRHGMPARPFRDAQDYVARVAQATYLIRRSDNAVIPSARPFTEHLREHGADFEAFLFHEHYVWNSARVRPAYGTVELRPACQQPWREHMAASALGVALVCAREAVEEYIADRLGPEAWEVMREYHRRAIRAGLDAPQPAPDFLGDMVGLAQAALEERGFGEEALLEPLHERLYRRENPAQRARRVFLTDGRAGMIAHAAISPAQL